MLILDTNMLLAPVDIIAEAGKFDSDIAVLSPTVRELERLAKSRGKARERARVALSIVKKLKIIRASGRTDAAILKYAAGNKCAVATNDMEMIKDLKMHKIRVLRLRQCRYLVEG